MKKESMERLVRTSVVYMHENLCPRCGSKMRPDKVLNSLSRYAGVYICNDCGMDEAMLDMAKAPLPFEEWDVFKSTLEDMNDRRGRARFIAAMESDIYTGKNVDGEDVIIKLQQGDGMTVSTRHAEKPKWWEDAEYDADGDLVSVSYSPVK